MTVRTLTDAIRDLRRALQRRDPTLGEGMRLDRALLVIAKKYSVEIAEEERRSGALIEPHIVDRLTAAVEGEGGPDA